MKKILLSLGVLVLCSTGFAQLLNWSPAFPTDATATLDITVDATKGNKGLDFYTPNSDVYVHIGVITNLSTDNGDWRYVKLNANFNLPVAALNATYTGSFPVQKWRFSITGGIRAFFGVPAGETIQKIAILFRNGAGNRVQRNTDGSDMYIPVTNGSLETAFTTPFYQPMFTPIPEPIVTTVGSTFPIAGIASASSNMVIRFNGNAVATQNNVTSISASPTIVATGLQTVQLEATAGTTSAKTFSFFIPAPNDVQPLPAGVKQGINYEADQTAATLVLYAPNKTRVSIIGDMPGSNWQEQTAYQMKKTADGNYYWLRLTGLTPGTEYAFQYLVDGNLRIGDPYAEKVLDPWNDQYIPASTYPALKPYPTGLTSGVATVLQTASPAYTWQTNSFARPDKRNLMVYELLLRDFIERHDWTGMTDTLNYLKKLGINTIELMPINEFEGNLSWGYNPDYYLAPDKYYGPKNDLKRFIDMAHSRGIAVVLDIALNHSFGLSPMVQLYWNAAQNRPAANNPWFYETARHPYNVGFDMNHTLAPTKYFFSRVVEHWLTEYKIDGFRFDLSKGFTTQNYCTTANCNTQAEIDNWGNYSAGRIAIWKDYYDTLQLKSPGSYVILEHFANNTEDIELSNYKNGMLLWGNVNYNFSEASKGEVGNSNFDWALHTARNWTNAHLISYMESHDEERMMYRNINEGNQSNPAHNTRSLPVALQRMGTSAAFLLTMPGPKMIWQFGEMGYDYSINRCGNGTINDGCRTDAKPIEWGYLQVPERKALHDVYANLLALRSNPLYTEAFTTGTVNRGLNGAFKWMTINSAAGKLVVIGNFDVVAQTGAVTFPAAGTWYNYLNPPATFAATGASQSFTLQPGEYRVYLNSLVVLPVTITNFNGRHNAGRNNLTWLVENEINLSRYELQRSSNGTDFTTITSLNATGSKNYSYTDTDIKLPVYFYRLKSFDRDGTYAYSPVVKLSGAIKNINVAATPNPFGNTLKLNIASPEKEAATVILSDLSGKILLQKNVALLPGINLIQIDQLQSLAAGTYILNLVSAKNKTSIRVIKSLE
ncbi:MAG: T9SS type A sorting domain-containing protein [Chitinophagaceae bacterium]|nr:MAG: T9SS type A sorting domain-containing protein [Chitinophagaceae bacterium]